MTAASSSGDSTTPGPGTSEHWGLSGTTRLISMSMSTGTEDTGGHRGVLHCAAETLAEVPNGDDSSCIAEVMA